MEKIINLLKWFIKSKVWGELVIKFEAGKIVNIRKTESLKGE